MFVCRQPLNEGLKQMDVIDASHHNGDVVQHKFVMKNNPKEVGKGPWVGNGKAIVHPTLMERRTETERMMELEKEAMKSNAVGTQTNGRTDETRSTSLKRKSPRKPATVRDPEQLKVANLCERHRNTLQNKKRKKQQGQHTPTSVCSRHRTPETIRSSSNNLRSSAIDDDFQESDDEPERIHSMPREESSNQTMHTSVSFISTNPAAVGESMVPFIATAAAAGAVSHPAPSVVPIAHECCQCVHCGFTFRPSGSAAAPGTIPTAIIHTFGPPPPSHHLPPPPPPAAEPIPISFETPGSGARSRRQQWIMKSTNSHHCHCSRDDFYNCENFEDTSI